MNNNKSQLIIDNSPLFKYINPNQNDSFSNMNAIDLQELLYNMENYYLKLRKNIGISESITFGLELEFERSMTACIKSNLRKKGLRNDWILKNDGSLNHGNEINSPILTDTASTWKNLEKVCSIVKKYATIGENSGGHIHIGSQILGPKAESWFNFMKLWAVYENVIYRFAYGQKLTARLSIMEYAPPISQFLLQDLDKIQSESKQNDIEYIVSMLKWFHRHNALNFENVKNCEYRENKNTIEFRCPNGTLEPVVWQNNVNLIVNLLLYCRNLKFDDDLIEKRRKLNQDIYDLGDIRQMLVLYEEVYLDQALELCDLLFANNYDKVYFLRQYLKSFEINEKPLVKAKKFIR